MLCTTFPVVSSLTSTYSFGCVQSAELWLILLWRPQRGSRISYFIARISSWRRATCSTSMHFTFCFLLSSAIPFSNLGSFATCIFVTRSLTEPLGPGLLGIYYVWYDSWAEGNTIWSVPAFYQCTESGTVVFTPGWLHIQRPVYLQQVGSISFSHNRKSSWDPCRDSHILNFAVWRFRPVFLLKCWLESRFGRCLPQPRWLAAHTFRNMPIPSPDRPHFSLDDP